MKQKIFSRAVGAGTTITSVHRVHFLKTAWFRYAVAFMAIFATLSYLWTKKSETSIKTIASNTVHDIAPADQGAILVLADGTQLILDSLGNRVLANQNGMNVVLKDGLLSYDKTSPSSGIIMYNTVRTPKGQQFQLVLPDGSTVRLNAGSSLRFPTIFESGERKVELTGEAYFEVKENATAPFKITPGPGSAILVLGTSLNVNAYENEPAIAATLISARIKVALLNDTVTIIPGQQAIISKNITIEKNADLAKVMAWKNGAFDFNGGSLRKAMRQIERWYDIEVAYESGVPDELPFSGRISRKISLKNLLQRLEETPLNFRLEGNKLIIKNKS